MTRTGTIMMLRAGSATRLATDNPVGGLVASEIAFNS